MHAIVGMGRGMLSRMIVHAIVGMGKTRGCIAVGTHIVCVRERLIPDIA
jgi:hypothetical protein